MKRGYGDGGIDARGPNTWRLRYRVDGKRHTKAFHGTKSEAQKELRRLLASADKGEHVAPDRITLTQWTEHWLAIGAPGRRQKKVGHRTVQSVVTLPCFAEHRRASAAATPWDGN
jgi:integrase